jgi:hypothetical protein
MNARRCLGCFHQQEAQQGISLFADMPQSLLASTGLLTRDHPNVRADRLNGAEAAAVLKNDMPETPVILFTLTDLPIDSLCAAIGVDFISKVDGVSKLLERVDALLPPTLPNEGATLW